MYCITVSAYACTGASMCVCISLNICISVEELFLLKRKKGFLFVKRKIGSGKKQKSRTEFFK
jgi:hypothetical protein